jgi:hypothetical protein
MSQLAREMGNLGRFTAYTTPWFPYSRQEPHPADVTGEPPPRPDWAEDEGTSSDDPARDLGRLLDHFRDDVRDAARDHGVSEGQLREARRHLSTAAAHLVALLRSADVDPDKGSGSGSDTNTGTDTDTGMSTGGEGSGV